MVKREISAPESSVRKSSAPPLHGTPGKRPYGATYDSASEKSVIDSEEENGMGSASETNGDVEEISKITQ